MESDREVSLALVIVTFKIRKFVFVLFTA